MSWIAEGLAQSRQKTTEEEEDCQRDKMLELDDCRDFPTHVSWDERIDLRQWKACGCTTR